MIITNNSFLKEYCDLLSIPIDNNDIITSVAINEEKVDQLFIKNKKEHTKR